MSMFESSQYRWRETYFVVFPSAKRPKLKKIKQTLEALSDGFVLTNLGADDQGRFESLSLLSPDDFAALDIAYVEGEEVIEQRAALADELRKTYTGDDERRRVETIATADARFDVLHFEQLVDDEDDELSQEEMLDPSALLVVLQALAEMTGGVAVDPQAGTLLP